MLASAASPASFFDTVTLVVFSTAGAFLGLSLRVDAAWVIVTGVRYVTVCRASSRFANHAKKSPGSYNNSHTRQEIGVGNVDSPRLNDWKRSLYDLRERVS